MPAQLLLPTLNVPNPQNPQGMWFWVYHVEALCKNDVAWYAGPFDTEPEAVTFRDNKLVDVHSCPGCGEPTPQSTDYIITQM